MEEKKTKIEKKEKKEKLLQEVIVKIGLKQEEEEEGVVTRSIIGQWGNGVGDEQRICKEA